MRMLISGDRNWKAYEVIKYIIERHQPDVVIHGNARGADKLADLAARSLDIPVEVYPAEWDKYGKPAGVIRNQQMLDKGKPDILWAFHDDIDNSKGTKDMVKRGHKVQDLAIFICDSSGNFYIYDGEFNGSRS